ncbi:MAG TPA: ABC transporter substrate-binding protein [Chloroflexota bacterium]|nr:ABC transporter substrate-binding protein [Chloroflexota bacterium]
MDGRCLRGAALVAFATLAAAACGGTSAPSAAHPTPFAIGFELELSGPFAANGKQIQDGWYLGLHDFGDTVAGRKIEATFVDEQGDPNVALTQARQLWQVNHVQMLEGPTAANAAAAVASFTGPNRIPVDDVALCSSQQLDSYRRYGNGYASAWSCDQPSIIAARWAYEQGYRHVTTVGMDYAYGWEGVGSFVAAFRKLGGTIDREIWGPQSTADWSPYVTQIPADTQAVFALMAGAESVRFTNAYGQFGLNRRIPLIGNTTLFDQSALPSENPAYVQGSKMAAQYCDGIDTPANRRFVDEVHRRYGDYPGYYTYTGYVKAERAVAALRKLQGKVSGSRALIQALQSVKVAAPTGTVTLSPATHSPVQNIFICQVETVGGSLRNVPIETYRSVNPWGILSPTEWEGVFRRDSAGRPA